MATLDDETRDLVEQLREVMDEEDFIALIDSAHLSGSDDKIREAYSSLVASGTEFDVSAKKIVKQQEERLATAGIDIIEVIGKSFDQRTKEYHDSLLGYELIRKVGDRLVYCGVSGFWGARYSSLPFTTRDKAREHALIYLDSEDPRTEYPPCNRQSVTFFVAIGVEVPKVAAQLNLKMTVEETAKMDAILRGLRAQNVELEENRPVNAYGHVVRYLLSKIELR